MAKEPDFELELTVDEIRQMFDTGDPIEKVDNILDEAQGPVHTGEKEETTVLITVKKGS